MDTKQIALLRQRNAELEKELEIEAALEKVRSRSLAVHKSDEFNEVIKVLFESLQELKIAMTSVSINVFIAGSKDTEVYICGTGEDRLVISNFRLIYFDNPISNDRYTAYEKGLDFFAKTYSKEEKDKFYEYEFEVSDLKHVPAGIKKMVMESECYTISMALSKNAMIVVNDFEGKTLSPKEIDIIKRFSRVFEQAYVRFLDLQKAEAQAREAHVQLALERVRARAMAMQKSGELAEAAKLLYNELRALDINPVSCGYMFINEEQQTQTAWVTLPDGTLLPDYIVFPLTGDPILNDRYKGWKQKEPLHKAVIEGEVNKEHHQFLSSQVPENFTTEIFEHIPENIVFYSANFSAGYLMIIATELFSAEEEHTIIRFAKVFEITYTRFLDLQRAEAQTREAQIELAMERVRARTMAMQQSDELSEAAKLLFQQVQVLHLPVLSCGYNIWQNGETVCTAWMSDSSGSILPPFSIPLTESPTFIHFKESKQKGEHFYIEEVSGEALAAHYRYMISLPNFKDIAEGFQKAGFTLPTHQINHVVNFLQGNLIFITDQSVPDAHDIFKRFGKVFEQTYTRFLDLQHAERQAREARIEAALERVRSRSMAMHKSEEVMDVAVTVYDQLQKLDFKFGAATIIIIDEKTGHMEHWLAGFLQKNHIESYEVNNSEHPLHAAQLAAWKKGEKYISIEMTGPSLKSYADEMFTQTGYSKLPDEEKAMLSAQEHAIFNLAYMSHGALMWAPTALSEENAIVLQRFAKVFEQTYTRFLDLQKAEAQAVQAGLHLIQIQTEKKRAEDALANLQQTQKQLIQAEKMASLGELTAGIAHEIQNPLNFVNNFSEVNKELLEEMKVELESGNTEEVKEIANEIIGNEEKINHHGKRADAIVKNMLQHSRNSTSQKVPTDINKLADEYLRLSYHGLRAKDKSFQAEIKTGFDPSIPKINIVPQDIGRVLLNIYNNAFYTTNEKKKAARGNFPPTVFVQTKRLVDKIEIRVSDNGNGIPEAIKEKIFQPFFTTKPTGEGTGLGLSLAYDIIKAHGGELKVQSTEGEGSEFVIQLLH